MKTQLILGSLLAFSGIASAQWDNATGVNTTNGPIGIGTSPSYQLDVSTTNPGGDGIRISNNGTNGEATLRMENNTSGGHDYGLFAFGNGNPEPGAWALYDYTLADYLIYFRPDGRCGVGTGAPAYKLDVSTTNSGGDGIRISNNGTNGEATLRMDNNTTGGHDYGIFAFGNGNPQPGSWAVYDYTLNDYLIHFRNDGRCGIGTSTPAEKLSVNGNVAPNGDNLYSCGTSANRWTAVWANNGTIQTSDLRYKTNVRNLSYGMSDILKLRPVSYNWKDGDKKQHLGFIAQELRDVIGEVVYEGNDENKNLGVAYSELIPVLISGMQEQQAQIEKLEKQVEALTKQSGATGLPQLDGSNGFNMEQNIPNPFSNETLINYSLSEQTRTATLNVYDLSGKQITSFPLDTKGSSITVSSEKLAAGIYLYSIVTDGKIMDTKRMVVAKK